MFVPLDSASTRSTVVILDMGPSWASGFRGRIRQRAREGGSSWGSLPSPFLSSSHESHQGAALGALRGSVTATVLGAQESTVCISWLQRMKPEHC